jgi:hypothetical protein
LYRSVSQQASCGVSIIERQSIQLTKEFIHVQGRR